MFVVLTFKITHRGTVLLLSDTRADFASTYIVKCVLQKTANCIRNYFKLGVTGVKVSSRCVKSNADTDAASFQYLNI